MRLGHRLALRTSHPKQAPNSCNSCKPPHQSQALSLVLPRTPLLRHPRCAMSHGHNLFSYGRAPGGLAGGGGSHSWWRVITGFNLRHQASRIPDAVCYHVGPPVWERRETSHASTVKCSEPPREGPHRTEDQNAGVRSWWLWLWHYSLNFPCAQKPPHFYLLTVWKRKQWTQTPLICRVVPPLGPQPAPPPAWPRLLVPGTWCSLGKDSPKPFPVLSFVPGDVSTAESLILAGHWPEI